MYPGLKGWNIYVKLLRLPRLVSNIFRLFRTKYADNGFQTIMSLLNKVLPIIIVFAFSVSASAQGCSDAGFCTLNTIKDHGEGMETTYDHRNSFSAGITPQFREESQPLLETPLIHRPSPGSRRVPVSLKDAT